MSHSQGNQGADSSISYDILEFLAAGKLGVVYGIDQGRILKKYHDEENDIDVEH